MLAKKISGSLTESVDGFPSVHQVAVSKQGDLGVYKGFVRFGHPPQPEYAKQNIEDACLA